MYYKPQFRMAINSKHHSGYKVKPEVLLQGSSKIHTK